MLRKFVWKTNEKKYLQQVIHSPESLYVARPVDLFVRQNILQLEKNKKRREKKVVGRYTTSNSVNTRCKYWEPTATQYKVYNGPH